MVELVTTVKQCQRISRVKWLVEEQSESQILQLAKNPRGTKPSIITGTRGKFDLKKTMVLKHITSLIEMETIRGAGKNAADIG